MVPLMTALLTQVDPNTKAGKLAKLGASVLAHFSTAGTGTRGLNVNNLPPEREWTPEGLTRFVESN